MLCLQGLRVWIHSTQRISIWDLTSIPLGHIFLPVRIESSARTYPTLKAWRKAQRIRQNEAAKRLGVSQGYYSRLERQIKFPHAHTAKVITDKTGVPLETLLGIAS